MPQFVVRRTNLSESDCRSEVYHLRKVLLTCHGVGYQPHTILILLDSLKLHVYPLQSLLFFLQRMSWTIQNPVQVVWRDIWFFNMYRSGRTFAFPLRTPMAYSSCPSLGALQNQDMAVVAVWMSSGSKEFLQRKEPITDY
jgi:hypothetical protein